jgi:uncharacterized Zn-finger protein
VEIKGTEEIEESSQSEPLFHVDVIPAVQDSHEGEYFGTIVNSFSVLNMCVCILESHSAGPSTSESQQQEEMYSSSHRPICQSHSGVDEGGSHSVIQNHDCVECNKADAGLYGRERAGPSSLPEHLDHAPPPPHGAELHPFHCHQCGKSFRQLINLQMHMKLHSLREKKYACDYCDKRFKRAQELTVHR